MKRQFRVGVAWLLMAFAVPASGVNPREFAFGAAIDVDGKSAMYVVPLTWDVYANSYQGSLLDLCVLNGSNEVVPFEIRHVVDTRQPAVVWHPLPLFRLFAKDKQHAPGLNIRLRSRGAAVDFSQAAPLPDGAIPVAYLLDSRKVAAPLRTLLLHWPADSADFAAHLQVETSDDLQIWSTVVVAAPVVNLHFAGRAFARTELAVPPARVRYWRLSWVGEVPKVALTGASGAEAGPASELPRLSKTVTGRRGETSGEYRFDVGAALPIDRVNLLLPQPNTVVEVEFFALGLQDNTWRWVARGGLHRLQVAESDDLTNAPLGIAATTARHWRVRVNAAGGGLGHGAPRFVAGWLPHELVFAARGTPPFRLLYGNAEAKPTAVKPGTLADAKGTYRGAAVRLLAHPATLGAPVTMGGTARLLPPPAKTDWRRWILWSGLVLAVAVLAWMAWRLGKSIH